MIAAGPELVIVDLTDVSFIDSTGLGVLVGAVRDVRADGGDLRLVVTEPQIIKLLELTGLDEVFSRPVEHQRRGAVMMSSLSVPGSVGANDVQPGGVVASGRSPDALPGPHDGSGGGDAAPS